MGESAEIMDPYVLKCGYSYGLVDYSTIVSFLKYTKKSVVAYKESEYGTWSA